jgi:hypothetical protein
MVFSDLHYGEGASKDARSDAFQERLLELEAPVDLVVLNGDMSSNYAAPSYCNRPTSHAIVRQLCKDWWIKRWKQYTSPLKKHGVPYALNVGNHDALAALDDTARELLAFDRASNYPLSHTLTGPQNVSRASNYFLPIFPPAAPQGDVHTAERIKTSTTSALEQPKRETPEPPQHRSAPAGPQAVPLAGLFLVWDRSPQH